MAFRWRTEDGPTLTSGLVALGFFRGSGPVLLRSPIYCDLQGGPDPLPPSLDPRIAVMCGCQYSLSLPPVFFAELSYRIGEYPSHAHLLYCVHT